MGMARASWLILLGSLAVMLPLVVAAIGMIKTASPYLVAANGLKLAVYSDFSPTQVVNVSTQLEVRPNRHDQRCQGSVRFEKKNAAYDCYFMRDDASVCEGLTSEAF